jgi:hypothetical protein
VEIITPAIKHAGFRHSGEAGIQAGAGCRTTSGMTALAYSFAGPIRGDTDEKGLDKCH